MKTTLLPVLALGGALVVASPALAEQQSAAPAPAGPVVLSDAELDRVAGGDASCTNCSGSSVSDNDSSATANATGISVGLSVEDLVTLIGLLGD